MTTPLDATWTGQVTPATQAPRYPRSGDGIAQYIVPAATLWIVALLEWLGAFSNAPRLPWLYAALAFAATVYGITGLVRLRGKARQLARGRDGEREVAHTLSSLHVRGTRLFHGVPAEGFHLDHVVICDRGIFVVETRSFRAPHDGRHVITLHEGELFRDGTRAPGDPLGRAAREAQWLCDLLRRKTGRGYRCQPVLLFPGWTVEKMDEATRATSWVLNPKTLIRWIEKSPVRLTADDVYLAADALMGHMRDAREERAPR